MKVYTFGEKENPAIMLLPGTFCDWKSNFGKVIPYLEKNFQVLCVSYDGFDETEKTEFTTVTEEVEKIEQYIKQNFNGSIKAVYGCSLGGSLVGLLVARQNIHIDFGILGSSDLDQSGAFMAGIMSKLVLKIIYPLIRDGKPQSEFVAKRLEQSRQKYPEYSQAFMDIIGMGKPYLTEQSCKNQFYSDLVTPLPNDIDVPDSEIHIFYALKMGEKYRKRYLQHFRKPVIHEQDMQHEEFLACYPEKWAELVTSIALNKE